MKLNSLFPDFDSSVQFFSQEVSLGALHISERFTRKKIFPTLFNIKTRCAFLRRRFEHTIVHNCSESSILFVRGSSSRYCGGKGPALEEPEQPTEMRACITDLIKSADWSKENDGGSYRMNNVRNGSQGSHAAVCFVAYHHRSKGPRHVANTELVKSWKTL